MPGSQVYAVKRAFLFVRFQFQSVCLASLERFLQRGSGGKDVNVSLRFISTSYSSYDEASAKTGVPHVLVKQPYKSGIVQIQIKTPN